MKVNFIANRDKTKTALLEIDDVRICYRNFRGEGSMYNAEGKRNFSIVIPDPEIVEALQNDVNELGVGWKIKIRAPREEGEAPFYHMPVQVKYTERSQPVVYVVVNDEKRIELDEDTIGMLDDISIERVDLDIRPYDGESHFGPHRTAYLQRICVYQKNDLDRFAARFAEEDDDYEEYAEE